MADRWASLAARAPVTIVFGVLGLSTGTWAARIPAIKTALHLSPGVLGLTLLGPALGSVLAMPVAGAILATVPPRRVVQCGLLFLAGLPASAAAAITVTLLVAVVQATVGLWLGRALAPGHG